MSGDSEKIRELKGGNMDIELIPNPSVPWPQDSCPWNIAEDTTVHKCAIKNVSICDYFRGVKPFDIVQCAYPGKTFE